MAIAIQPFEASRVEAVADFNRRMRAGDSRWQFPERPEPSWLAPAAGSPVFQEFFLALDGEVVRGAYALQHRPAAFRGEEQGIGSWYLPISEGAVDAKHALVAMHLVRDSYRRAPLSFGLGLDGLGSPLAKLLAALRFDLRLLPFFVRIENGTRVAREARYLRRRRAVAKLLDVAAATGLARLGAGLVKLALARAPRLAAATSVESVAEFGPWADELWLRCRARYSFVELRDAATLNRVYPSERPRLQRLRIVREGATVGWAVLQRARMSGNPNFGDLHVGRITDGFAAPEDAALVVRAAADALAREGVDLMLSNQSHPAWCAALRRSAFLPAPSNFVFAPSPELGRQLRAIDPEGRELHLNRGDGDGPWGHDPGSF